MWVFKAESERESEFFTQTTRFCNNIWRISKRRRDGKKMDDFWPKNEKFLMWRTAQKKSKFGRQNTTANALYALFLLLFEDPTTFKRYETKNNESTFTERRLSAWWYVRFEIRWANANRKPHRRKRSNRNWTRNSRVRFAITTNRSPRNWTFNNTKG